MKIELPIVVRLTGTNSDLAAELINKYNEEQLSKKAEERVNIIVQNDFDKAAGEVVK